jgi:hypothetical protein
VMVKLLNEILKIYYRRQSTPKLVLIVAKCAKPHCKVCSLHSECIRGGGGGGGGSCHFSHPLPPP